MNSTESFSLDDQVHWITVFNLLNQNFSKFGMGLIWLVGNLGSIVNCFVFSQPTLRKNPCVMYLLASSASQFLTFNFALITRMLQYGYNIQTINTVLWYCRIRYYFFYIFVAIPRYCIILASIDRYFISSLDIRYRRWSSPRIAKRLLIINTVFWSLIYIQVLVTYVIQNGSCGFGSDAYAMFFSIYISIDSGILPPFIMIVFGLLTIRNIRNSKRTIRPATNSVSGRPSRRNGMSRKDLQFSKMLFNQICLWVTLNLLNPCYLLYQTISMNTIKSPLRLTVESFINNMTYFLIYLGFSLTVFVYTLSSHIFRRELKQSVQRKLLRHIAPNVPLRNNTH